MLGRRKRWGKQAMDEIAKIARYNSRSAHWKEHKTGTKDISSIQTHNKSSALEHSIRKKELQGLEY